MKKIKMISIAAIVFIGISAMFTYSFIEKSPLAFTQNYEIKVSGKVNEVIKKSYQIDYDNLKNELKDEIKSITITDENLSDKFNINLDGSILAITYGNDIYINAKQYNENVIVHEAFHAFDYNNNWLSDSSEFNIIYEKEKDLISVSPGNAQNAAEFFASCGEIYYSNPEMLKTIAPLTFNFFEKYL